MPATGGRRGRRDNGLVAAEYASVGDVDPRIGEHLLDVLGVAHIAAYLQPSTDLHPVTRTTSLPSRPTDRLFVDREHLGTAQNYLRQVTTPEAGAGPDRGPVAADQVEPTRETGARDTAARDTAAREPAARDTDVDAAWREIVAGFHLSVNPADPPWPRSEDVTLGEPRPLPHIDPGLEPVPESRARRRVEPAPDPTADPAEPSLLDALDTFGATLPDDDDGYTPPPPPPLPRISSAAALGVAAIAFGLLLFVWPSLLPLAVDTVLLLAFASIVIGFGTLIWRLRPGDEDDDDLDDGARI